jgi:hypothetical protein
MSYAVKKVENSFIRLTVNDSAKERPQRHNDNVVIGLIEHIYYS